MTRVQNIPIVDVTQKNISTYRAGLEFAIQNADFIAIDLELSGLGNRGSLLAKSIDDRYHGMCEAAKTRAILSLGLACFKFNKGNEAKAVPLFVQTFNLTSLCCEEYVVEPESMKFLVQHGFDFNRQYEYGLPYYRGNDRLVTGKKKKESSPLRQLVTHIIETKIPLVFHNGLLDIVFFYHHFYAELPSKLSSFLCDLTELFPSGVFDTKYLAEFVIRCGASFLEYVFKRSVRDNEEQSAQNRKHIEISCPSHATSTEVVMRGYSTSRDLDHSANEESPSICLKYSAYGFCTHANCNLSHSVDHILDKEDIQRAKKRNRRDKSQNNKRAKTENPSSHSSPEDESNSVRVDESRTESTLNSLEDESVEELESNPILSIGLSQSPGEDSNRAGFDAFMTGFSFAHFLITQAKTEELDKLHESSDWKGLIKESFINHLFLSGRSQPLVVQKSAFGKTSKQHEEKVKRMFNKGDSE